MSENVGVSTSCNPKGPHGLYRDKLKKIEHRLCSIILNCNVLVVAMS
jgi:hypothetical protein